MTSTTDPLQLAGSRRPRRRAGLARAQKRAEDDAAREVMKGAAGWAAMHSSDSLVGPVDRGTSRRCPWVAKAARRSRSSRSPSSPPPSGKSTESGRRYLSQVVEGRYRLLALLGQAAGRAAAGVEARPASPTAPCASHPQAAAFVDPHVAAVAHKIGPAQLGRLIEEAIARFDPEQAEAERLAAAETRHLDVDLAQVSVTGTVHVEGDARPGRRHRLQRRRRRRRPPTAARRVDRVTRRTPLHRRRQPRPPPTDPRPGPADDDPHHAAWRRKKRRWCSTSTSNTPRSSAPAGWPGSRRPPARSPPNRSGSGAATPTPRSPCNRSSTWPSTSTSTPTKPPPGSSSRPSSAT